LLVVVEVGLVALLVVVEQAVCSPLPLRSRQQLTQLRLVLVVDSKQVALVLPLVRWSPQSVVGMVHAKQLEARAVLVEEQTRILPLEVERRAKETAEVRAVVVVAVVAVAVMVREETATSRELTLGHLHTMLEAEVRD